MTQLPPFSIIHFDGGLTIRFEQTMQGGVIRGSREQLDSTIEQLQWREKKRAIFENIALLGKAGADGISFIENDGDEWFLYEGPNIPDACTSLVGTIFSVRREPSPCLFKDREGRILIWPG